MKVLFIGGTGNISLSSTILAIDKGIEIFLLTRGTSQKVPKGATSLIADINDENKVKELINSHLISLGINPKVPPIELLSEDFLENLNKHAGGNLEAKASEMEHAVRKHCTVHHDEDPAFYKSLSEKVENPGNPDNLRQI